MIYADVIVDISHEKVDRCFQYRVPESLEAELRIGMVVAVPFGKGNRVRKGYVVGISTEAGMEPDKIKEIQEVLNDGETTESRLIALAEWMRENYGSTMIQALKTVLPMQEKVKAKEKRSVVLAVSTEEARALLEKWRGGRCKARVRILEALLEQGTLPYAQAVTLGMTPSVKTFFTDNGLIRMEQKEVYRIPVDGSRIPRAGETALSPAQERAVEAVRAEWQKAEPRPVLLRGVTGSGKTRVYMELIEGVLQKGQQAIVLIPEIALTYQTVQRFYGRFGDRVSVLHSRLSQGERYDQMKRARRGEIQVMVGPRSALFTPFTKLGLIVIDEEHEPTYKSEQSPRYHARETAVERARMEGAKVLMGSATPSLEAYHRAKEGRYLLVNLEERFEDRPLPEVSIVDLREELKAGNRSVFSRELEEAIQSCLKKKEQVMLFLNRRGYAGFVSCRSCGHVMKCPHCDVSLSEHRGGRLICHYCGYQTPKPEQCPVCGSPYIGGFKAGTQQIEQALQKRFPGARVLRMDYDTTRGKGSYEQILSRFAAQEADILVGTQMIVKGHDFPAVTLVGIIAADLSLNASDYRSGERTFQLLTQAVGRSGRGRSPGRAIIQTYHPEHYSIQAAAVQDYPAFYEEEIGYRTLLSYPPAARMLAVLGSCEDEEHLQRAMHYIGRFVKRVAPAQMQIIGPAPAPVGKVKDIYRQVLYLKYDEGKALVQVKDRLEQYIEINSGFRNIHIQYDFT